MTRRGSCGRGVCVWSPTFDPNVDEVLVGMVVRSRSRKPPPLCFCMWVVCVCVCVCVCVVASLDIVT